MPEDTSKSSDFLDETYPFFSSCIRTAITFHRHKCCRIYDVFIPSLPVSFPSVGVEDGVDRRDRGLLPHSALDCGINVPPDRARSPGTGRAGSGLLRSI